MDSKDIQSHQAMASSMNYSELHMIISELVEEKTSLSPYLSKNELKKYTKAIIIYKKALNFIRNLSNPRNHSTMSH